MPHHIASQVISPLAEIDRSHSLSARGRKMSSTGGNRSWSEEEENYLLQTRMQKMPYKHIAAHLKKTELACRLHYHQLSHGSHRRKRTGSVSSNNSLASTSSGSSGNSPRNHYYHGYDGEDDHGMGYSPVRYGVNTSPPYSSHKVLLPKPMPLTPPEHSDLHNGLRINTSMQTGNNVDTDRLRAIYDQHRSGFWNAIAQDYGPDASPSHLEQIWRHNHHSGFGAPLMRPPTPGDSPDRLGRPSLKPSPLPAFNPYSTADYRTNLGSLNSYSATAVSAPERMNFGFSLPTPNSAYAHTPQLHRANTWDTGYATTGQAPTAIASLLTENKCPRGSECTDVNCRSGHGRC
ncbi:hypothetical protein NA57DRAFT_59396 [Rhizodiscina lignyota]|uniref:Myb-like domain-containing protein n=1 Tax=Rhizodiscina lignyota TaxID=1504668 RepID=A0A9P4M717_9PEZI|nr:hypothetical protein NA57DRAFT_59396 [Rhizodiscina lignyota]